MKKILGLISLIGLSFASTNCAMCHNGGMASKLDNLTPEEIIKKMKDFKAGHGNPMMVNIAKAMSDEEIEKVAKEYGKK